MVSSWRYICTVPFNRLVLESLLCLLSYVIRIREFYSILINCCCVSKFVTQGFIKVFNTKASGHNCNISNSLKNTCSYWDSTITISNILMKPCSKLVNLPADPEALDETYVRCEIASEYEPRLLFKWKTPFMSVAPPPLSSYPRKIAPIKLRWILLKVFEQ